jgi:hypothetical protein
VTTPSAFAVIAARALCAGVAEPIPLLKERLHVALYVGFKLEHVFLREYVRDDFALACVRDAITGIEQATRDGDKGVVEVAFK